MKKGFTLLIISIILSTSIVLAGQLFDMDFSTNPQQVQILSKHDAVVLKNNGAEWGSIIINNIRGQEVDFKIYSSSSNKLISMYTMNSVDEIMQTDINKDGLADFIIDIQSPIKDGEVILIVKKLFEDTETPEIKTKENPSQITGAVANPPKEVKLTPFLITGLIVMVGLVSYYLFIHKKR